jgi:pimeloyl-ACP methyl ester carboxylesterase
MKKFILTILFFLIIIYTAQANEVSIVVNGCMLKGTLEIPKSGKPVDVVLIIAGSGPTDRDGNSTLLPGKNNSLKMLADSLYENGIASLRYDKRGIGASDKVNESDLTFDMYINDAVEWVKFLRKDKRFSKIIIAGHSEGSLIGMIVAERIEVDKFISLCGAGEPAFSLIEEQLKNNNLPKELLNKCNAIMDSLKLGITVKNVDPSLAVLFRPSVQPYMISWFKYDPVKEISKLTIPILVVEGTTDIQVNVKDAELLSKANKKSKLVIIENMNHILKEVPTQDRTKNIQSYSKPDLALSEKLCKRVIEFIKK